MAIGYRYIAHIISLDGIDVALIRYRSISASVTSSELAWQGRINSSQTLEIVTLDSVTDAVEKSPGNYRIRIGDKTYLIQAVQKHEVTPIASVLVRRYETILELR